jgi:hypothetical protein
MRTLIVFSWLVVVGTIMDGFTSPETARAADAKDDDAAREKIWNSPEMLHARAWLESYFRVAKAYPPEKAAAYRKALENMSAPEMELWLMKFEHDRAMARTQEAAFEQQRQAAIARDEGQLAQQRQALKNVNRDENRAASAAEKVITDERQEAERNYRQNAAEQSRLVDEYNRPYVPYFYGGYYGPASVHYHFHR